MRGRKKNQRKGDLGEEKGKLDCKEGSGTGVEESRMLENMTPRKFTVLFSLKF